MTVERNHEGVDDGGFEDLRRDGSDTVTVELVVDVGDADRFRDGGPEVRRLPRGAPWGRPCISTVFDSREATVVVVGEIDIAAAPMLRDALQEVSSGHHRKIVVDAALIDFIDAAAIGVILAARRRLATTGRQLVVRNPSSIVRRVLELVGLRDLMEGGGR